jgi:N4-gp56 family major capsid protein
MAIQNYGTQNPRVGTWRARILKHAMPVISLGTVGVNDDFKRNQGDIAKYRRWLPKGASASQPNRFFLDGAGDRSQAYVAQHLTSEGVTPPAETVAAQDIQVQLQEFSILYGYTNRTFDFYEDDIPKAMTDLAGERLGLVNESALFGVLKGCTNKFYGGTGTTRATVNGRISLTKLRKIARSLHLNHAETVSKMEKRISGSNNYGTQPVGVCYPVWIHTDLIPDIRDLPNFTPVEKYGDPSQAVANECGKCETFRFIASPELVAIQDAGAAVAGSVPALMSTTGTFADVYQVIVGSKDGWGHVGLNLKSGNVSALPVGQRDKSDPLGQRGYVGASWYYNAVVLNDLQMAVYEVATSALAE